MVWYVLQLLKLGLVKKVTSPKSMSSPLNVPRLLPSIYRLTVYYRLVNNSMLYKLFHVPNIESELFDSLGSQVFSSIEFCIGYWHLPLHFDIQTLLSFMNRASVLILNRTTKGGTNSMANFEEIVSSCFAKLSGIFKTWIDEFIIF